MGAKETTVGVRMDESLRNRLEALAAESGLSLSELIRALLLHSLKCRTVHRFLRGH
jgi:antitoxin component of RelBE/YafQ-DinJ toxin-antitoxin module